MEIRKRLNKLSSNLYWTWHTEISDIFRDLNPKLWSEHKHNPMEFMAELSDEFLDKRIRVLALESRITRAYHILRDYLETEETWGYRRASKLHYNPIAYFSAEFGIHESLPIYSGGLGILSGDHLKAASDLGVPLIGVGLLYEKGYFTQSLDQNGRQQESYSEARVERLPLERVTDRDGNPLCLHLDTPDDDPIYITAWTASLGRGRLVLIDTNVDKNNEENRKLTAQLYGGDEKMRIRQEYVLGVGGLRMLHAMGRRPGVIHMNEGHSAFATLEMARFKMEQDNKNFDQARQEIAEMSVFTTHTPVAAGHDRFEKKLITETLGEFISKLGLDEKRIMALGRSDPEDDQETFCMTVLGLKMSRFRNAVSHIHSRISRRMWQGIWSQEDGESVPVGYITNGVHLGTWLSPEIDRLFRRIIGERWMEKMSDPSIWNAVKNIDDEELWEIDEILHSRLIEFVRKRISDRYKARGEDDPTADESSPYLREDALTIGFARRFAGYKRCDLLMRDMNRLDKLVNNSSRPVQIIFAGKAHPADNQGKDMIQKVFDVSRDSRFQGRIAFVEDYDINVARQLVRGAHVWLNLPRRPLEACGTSGMKALINGTLNLSVLDGWWAEAYDGMNGFSVGAGGEHSDDDEQDRRDLEDLYQTLENEVVPMFYDRDQDALPRQWIHMQKYALKTLAWRFSSQRMVAEYTKACYLPAVGATTSSMAKIETPQLD